MEHPPLSSLLVFALAWTVGLYLVNCLIAREIKRINIRQALLHTSTMALIGVVGEVTVGSIYHFLFNAPLWNYTVFPVHHAYTSQYALFLWGVYGFHLHLLHGTVKKHKPQSIHWLAFLFCLEAIVIEALVNLTFKLSFGQFIYYYFPSDLWHLTSVQTLPFYYLAGYVIVYTFKKYEADPRFFTLSSAALALVFVFLT